MTKWNKKARSPKANAPKDKHVSSGSQPGSNGFKIQYIDSFDEVNCIGPYIVKMDGSQPTANELKLNGTIYIMRSEPSDEAMLDYVDKLEAAQARNDPGYAAYLARRDARESPAERRKRELAQMEASKAAGDSKTVEFKSTLNNNQIDNYSSKKYEGVLDIVTARRNFIQKTLRTGPEGTRPAIAMDGKCYVFNIELDESKIQALTGAFVAYYTNRISPNREKGKVEDAKRQALKLLTSIGEEDPDIATLISYFPSLEREECLFTVFRAPGDNGNYDDYDVNDIGAFLGHLAAKRRMFEENLRSGPEGTKPAILIDDKCYVINTELDEAKIQELTGALTACYTQIRIKEGRVDDAKRETLKLLTSIAEEDPFIEHIDDVLRKGEENEGVFAVGRLPVLEHKETLMAHLAERRKHFEGTLRSGLEGSKPAIAIDGKCYVINVELDEAKIQELTGAFMNFYAMYSTKKETFENSKREALQLLSSISEEDHEIAKLMAVIAKPEETFWVFRTPGHNEKDYCLPGFVPLETVLYTELTSGSGSGTIPGVIIDDGMYFLRAEPTEDNVIELVKAMLKYIGARQGENYPETIENLKQSVLDLLVPIEAEIELDKEDPGQRFDSDENRKNPIIVFRCRMKKATSDDASCKAESNEINANHGSLAVDAIESKDKSQVNSGNFAIDVDESKKESNENEEYEEVGNFNPHDIKCKCVIS